MKKFVLTIAIVLIIVILGVSITFVISDNLGLAGLKVKDLRVYEESTSDNAIIGGYISEDGEIVNDCCHWHSPTVLHFEAD